MAKDPAFLFYSSDFLTGISDLTMEERGQFITLLCIQHQKGRLTKKNIGIAVPNATADTLAKFKIDENGLYYNSRLEEESNKRKEHSEKQRQRALSGWKKRKAQIDTTADATALPLEDVNEDVNKDIIIDISIIKENYIKNDRLVKAVLGNKDLGLKDKKMLETKLTKFNEMLSSKNIFSDSTNEYTSYFLNWLKKNKQVQKRKSNIAF